MSKWKEWRKKEDGVTVVIIAISLTAILSMTALVLDLGLAYYHRAHLQEACDAAALAAAQELKPGKTDNDDAIEAMGVGCFKTNYSAKTLDDCKVENYDYVIDHTKGTVDTWGRMECPTGFAKVFGVNSIHIEAYAQAINVDMPNPYSPWNEALVANGPIGFDVGGFVSSAHSNEYIHIGAGLEVEDSITAIQKIEPMDKLHPHDTLNPPVISSGEEPDPYVEIKHYEIDVAAQEMRKKIGLTGKYPYKNTSSYTAWNLNDDNWVLTDPNRPKLISPAEYSGDKWFPGCDINADLCVDGTLTASGSTVTIAEGCTLFITGNLEANDGLVCNGNLIVLGNIQVGGHDGFQSTSSSTSYVYCEGKGKVQFGSLTDNCKNLLICAPKCSEFNIDGGSYIMTGSIVANASNRLNAGTSSLHLEYSDSAKDLIDPIHVFRLSK